MPSARPSSKVPRCGCTGSEEASPPACAVPAASQDVPENAGSPGSGASVCLRKITRSPFGRPGRRAVWDDSPQVHKLPCGRDARAPTGASRDSGPGCRDAGAARAPPRGFAAQRYLRSESGAGPGFRRRFPTREHSDDPRRTPQRAHVPRRPRRAGTADRHRLHVHRRAALAPDRALPAVLRHAGRRAPAVGRGGRGARGHAPVQQVQRHDLGRGAEPRHLRARHLEPGAPVPRRTA